VTRHILEAEAIKFVAVESEQDSQIWLFLEVQIDFADINMPEMDGIQMTKIIRNMY